MQAQVNSLLFPIGCTMLQAKNMVAQMKEKLYSDDEASILEAAIFFREQLSGLSSKMSAMEVCPSPP